MSEETPISWSSALPECGAYFLGSEGSADHLARLNVIQKRLETTSQLGNCKGIIWLVSRRLPNRLWDKWILVLVEPCLIDPRELTTEGITVLCLSNLTYQKFKKNYTSGKVVRVLDPLYDLTEQESKNLYPLLWNEDVPKLWQMPETKHFSCVLTAIKANQLVTWVDPPLYLLEELTDRKQISNVNLKWSKIPTYILVLERDRQRVAHVNSYLFPRIPKATRFSAIDGQETEKVNEILKTNGIKVSGELRSGQVGCALSHYLIWQDFLSTNSLWTIVLEDDSMLRSGYEQSIQAILRELPADFDWVYLYIFPKHYRDDEYVRIEGKTSINKAYFTYCTVGYIISRSGAKKLSRRLKKLDKPVDTIVSEEIQFERIKAYATRRTIIRNLGQPTSALSPGFKSNVWNSRSFVTP